jgi:hypothetical protein
VALHSCHPVFCLSARTLKLPVPKTPVPCVDVPMTPCWLLEPHTPASCISKLLVASALLILLVVAAPIAAQDKPAPETYAMAGPDTAGSAADDQTKAAASSQEASKDTVAPEDTVLKKSSIFFPDLATSRTPLTVDQKFRLFVKNRIAPSTILGSAFGAGINQAINTPSGYGQGAEGYGKRFGASLATRATTNLFGGVIIASIAHQDPRYFVHGHQGTFGQRLGHAISRVVVAPNERGGYGFNWGGVFGPLAAQTLANVYMPVREQTGARTLSRYGTQMATIAGANILKEFWADIFKHLGLEK